MKKNKMTMSIFNHIPPASFASDDVMLKAKREELKRRLLEGKKVVINPLTSAPSDSSTGDGIFIPKGKLAGDDVALKKKREELKRKLLEGKKITIGSSGEINSSVSSGGLHIPPGKLAVKNWYEKDPDLLNSEIIAMNRFFPNFVLDKLADGRYAWLGSFDHSEYFNLIWHVMAVYSNNHPKKEMGSSVRVYLVEPDIYDLAKEMKWTPGHLLRDGNNEPYLCTAEADNILASAEEVTSAASVLAWAAKWCMGIGLVKNGLLSKDDFSKHGYL